MDVAQTDVVVAGAGVVGLATAAALAKRGHEVLVLEAAARIGSETSSRNSEVIHAGIYYPAGSLKARLCVEGRKALYRYCDERQVAYRRCGKLIVANGPQERAQLERVAERAASNGVHDLEWWDARRIAREEPALRAEAALHSPSTGIVDSHGLMVSLLGELEDHGGMLALNAPVTRGEATGDGWRIEVGGEAPMAVQARWFVNAAGLHAEQVARALDGVDARSIPTLRYARGQYFSLAARAPTSRLVYPAPNEAGLGIHLTLDLAGRARFGPDVEWIDKPNYTIDAARAPQFYSAIRRYWPGLPDDSLSADYCGVRPKLVSPGEPAADFRIDGPGDHGSPGLINLFGIESPGLTASLAIGAHVASIIRGSQNSS